MSHPKAPHTEDIESLLSLAKRFTDHKRFDEAAELFLMALGLDPENMGVKLGLAELRKRQGDQTGSPPRSLRQAILEAQRRNAIDAAHFLGLARIYAEKGETGRALECLEVSLAKGLTNPAVHKLEGRIRFRRNEFDAAAEELDKALRLNPFDREVAESLGRAEYERKNFEPALRATIHAFLLLNDADQEGAERLRRRIQTLKRLLGWGNRELGRYFRERQETLSTAFDRLEWHRERFLEETGIATARLRVPTTRRRAPTGQIGVASRLREMEVLKALSDEQIFRLTKVVREEHKGSGSELFDHGSHGRDLYLLENGEIAIQRKTSYGTFSLARLGPGALFGEASFLTHQERSGDALVSRTSSLFRFDAEELDRLIDDQPDLGVQLFWTFWRSLAAKLRGTNEQLKSFFDAESQPENFLRLRRTGGPATGKVEVDSSDKIRLFREQGLSRKELMTLATFSQEKRFSAGAYLFQEGDEGDQMYVVLDGRAMISKYIPGAGEEALAILERGDFFGEMSLIDGAPRSADARAHGGPLTVLTLDEATVQEVLSMDTDAALEFLQLLCRLIAHRLREIDEKVIGWHIISGGRNTASA